MSLNRVTWQTRVSLVSIYSFLPRVFIALHGPCRGPLCESKPSRNDANNAKRRLPRHDVAFFLNGKGSPLFDEWRTYSVYDSLLPFPDDDRGPDSRFLKADIAFISRRSSTWYINIYASIAKVAQNIPYILIYYALAPILSSFLCASFVILRASFITERRSNKITRDGKEIALASVASLTGWNGSKDTRAPPSPTQVSGKSVSGRN